MIILYYYLPLTNTLVKTTHSNNAKSKLATSLFQHSNIVIEKNVLTQVFTIVKQPFLTFNSASFNNMINIYQAIYEDKNIPDVSAIINGSVVHQSDTVLNNLQMYVSGLGRNG